MNLHDMLRSRYQAPEYAIFFEVASGIGSTSGRYADALAVSLFPSRGLALHGFEIKESRSDWLRELKKPEKAEEIASYCHHWWVVVPDKALVHDGELPKPWGLLAPRGKKLYQFRSSEGLEPKALDLPILAAICRRAHEQMTSKFENDSRLSEEYNRGFERGKDVDKNDSEMAEYELRNLKKGLAAFEKRSGLRIDSWHSGMMGDAVRTLMNLREKDSVVELERVEREIRSTADMLRDQAKSLREYRKANGS